uniref:NADH-ubiquinone oxidoreductase chain 5 n=1 Tax=Franklinothrips vespiformis TaxID=297892 RepID=A0A8A5L625_FRAVS|nr:NADH dehydrogenase subunit 5 [Franklinothrips vespiformis]
MFKNVFFYLFFTSFLLLISSSYFVLESFCLVMEWEMFSMNSLTFSFLMILDYISLIFLSVVLLISSMVILYSSSYMSSEIFKSRFLILVLLFIFSMMFMILSPSLISILLGWDGLGLVSFCLVIYYQNRKSFSAGMLTALTNRIGDVLILLSISFFSNIGSWNFCNIFMLNSSWFMLISILICMASMTKSAQIPFSAWLPAAMAAPTPVSALVHSSTLVTAGVYLMIRFYSIVSKFDFLILLFLILSTCTMFMSGLAANVEMDLKKVIALSTLSQLGVMMSSLSLGMEKLCFFHLIIHALFKSLLFMCAGCFIHNNSDSQDIRFFGNWMTKEFTFSPLTSLYFNTANLALCGFPFMSGFYSKDLILEMCFLNSMNLFMMVIFFFSTGLTVSYTVRLILMSLASSFNYISVISKMGDNSKSMNLSMMFMFFMSLMAGKAGLSFILIFPYNYIVLPFFLKFTTLFVCLMGLIFGFYLNKLKWKIFSSYKMFEFLNKMWFLTIISPNILKTKIMSFSLKISKITTNGWMELFLGMYLPMVLIGVSSRVEISSKIHMNILFFLIFFMFFCFLFTMN